MASLANTMDDEEVAGEPMAGERMEKEAMEETEVEGTEVEEEGTASAPESAQSAQLPTSTTGGTTTIKSNGPSSSNDNPPSNSNHNPLGHWTADDIESVAAPPSTIHIIDGDDQSTASSVTTLHFHTAELFVPNMYPSTQTLTEAAMPDLSQSTANSNSNSSTRKKAPPVASRPLPTLLEDEATIKSAISKGSSATTAGYSKATHVGYNKKGDDDASTIKSASYMSQMDPSSAKSLADSSTDSDYHRKLPPPGYYQKGMDTSAASSVAEHSHAATEGDANTEVLSAPPTKRQPSLGIQPSPNSSVTLRNSTNSQPGAHPQAGISSSLQDTTIGVMMLQPDEMERDASETTNNLRLSANSTTTNHTHVSSLLQQAPPTATNTGASMGQPPEQHAANHHPHHPHSIITTNGRNNNSNSNTNPIAEAQPVEEQDLPEATPYHQNSNNDRNGDDEDDEEKKDVWLRASLVANMIMFIIIGIIVGVVLARKGSDDEPNDNPQSMVGMNATSAHTTTFPT